MGIGSAGIGGKAALDEFSSIQKINDEFRKLKNYWHSRIEGFTAETPDKEFNSMLNM